MLLIKFCSLPLSFKQLKAFQSTSFLDPTSKGCRGKSTTSSFLAKQTGRGKEGKQGPKGLRLSTTEVTTASEC